jgi:hypothetical protein
MTIGTVLLAAGIGLVAGVLRDLDGLCRLRRRNAGAVSSPGDGIIRDWPEGVVYPSSELYF